MISLHFIFVFGFIDIERRLRYNRTDFKHLFVFFGGISREKI